MRRQRRRIHIIGPLIFAALVALAGAGFVATDNVADPFDFLSTFYLIQRADEHYAQLPSFEQGQRGHGSIQRPDPPSADQNDIDWSAILAVFFDLWVLCAVTAGYILAQQTLSLLISRFRSAP